MTFVLLSSSFTLPKRKISTFHRSYLLHILKSVGCFYSTWPRVVEVLNTAVSRKLQKRGGEEQGKNELRINCLDDMTWTCEHMHKIQLGFCLLEG